MRACAVLFSALGVVLAAGQVAAAGEKPTFFPNLTKVYVPRGTSQLLKPYLPPPEGSSADYRFVVETPDYLKFVAVEPSQGDPPRRVRSEPGPTRDGVVYQRHVLEYDAYPTRGFELSLCWLSAGGSTLSYQPAIARGGTHDWRRVEGRVNAPEGAAQVRLLVIKWQNRGISGAFWVDNVVFRRANEQKNLLPTGTFDEPQWKSGLLKPEGKDGRRCAKFVCPPEMADRQQALWLDPERQPIPVRPGIEYVVELDLKTEKLEVGGASHIAALLFRADEKAPEGAGRIDTYFPATEAESRRTTELVILPPLKNVRPKFARIAPCHYATNYLEPKTAEAYADNVWRSGITWTYGSVHNNVVSLLASRGHRVWLAMPGEPFAAHGKTRATLDARPELRALGFDGKPLANLFCPTWLLSSAGADVRRTLGDEMVELVEHDGYTAVNWDIEQPVCLPVEGGKGVKGFCLCPRCLEAFRTQEKIPAAEKLDSQAILARHKDAWVLFRCRQNAELTGHVRAAFKRCIRPIEFSVYSGYQGQQTRETYGVDWSLLAPHLDLAIAGYGGSRSAVQATLTALGKTPFIGGQSYYLSAVPQQSSAAWMRNSLRAVPNPLAWRNRLLQQYVESGCQGVLIWYLPTMDGGAFYYTSEAAEIIAKHEDLFRSGKRCDAEFRVAGLKAEQWMAIDGGSRRLLLLLNTSAKAASVDVEQPDLEGRWNARLDGPAQPDQLNAQKFSLPLEPWDARIVLFSRPPANPARSKHGE